MKRKTLEQILQDVIDQLEAVEVDVHPEVERLATELEAARTRAQQAENRQRMAQAEVDMMRRLWRPVPIKHAWEPRDSRCALCDESRDSSRHAPDPGPQWCGCGAFLDRWSCHERGMACVGPVHTPGCLLPKGHGGAHDWQVDDDS